ncbi:hypothetical protein [Streptomyces alboflavus]|uniref:hypothetical protein n=1 Tax=Streptomyces alboflavus TaxID=67267 RepID=UPI0036A2EC5A
MSSADHLAAIDLLRARDFPETPGRSEHGYGGPGFHVAELSTYDQLWDDDGTAHEETEARCEAERDALRALLTERWGEPRLFGLTSVLIRVMAQEADGSGASVTNPWATLSESVPDVHLWRSDGQWIALGVARWGERLAVQLLAVVTVVDPP